MPESYGILVARRLAAGGVLLWAAALVMSCEEESLFYSDPVTRVATRADDDSWQVQTRNEDDFATYHSIFASQPGGLPIAMRNVGGELRVGWWTGSDWKQEVVGTTASVGDGDQLETGVLEIDSDGNPHAVFSTALDTYYAGRGSEGWQVLTLPKSAARSYDLAIGPDGDVLLLYMSDEYNTVLSLVAGPGKLNTEVVYDYPVGGSIDVSPDGTTGILLWVVSASASGMTARLYERSASSTIWEGTDVVTNGYLCYECDEPETSYVPQLMYRGDGVPVVLYVDTYAALYMAIEGSDGLFTRNPLANGGQVFQYARMQRSEEGTVGTAVILDYARLGLARTGPSIPFLFDEMGSGVDAITPRFVFYGEDVYLAFWDSTGVWAVAPDTSGSSGASLVDGDVNDGFFLGLHIGSREDGQPQLFYNEIHVVE